MTIETGIQNSGLGLLIIFSFFGFRRDGDYCRLVGYLAFNIGFYIEYSLESERF